MCCLQHASRDSKMQAWYQMDLSFGAVDGGGARTHPGCGKLGSRRQYSHPGAMVVCSADESRLSRMNEQDGIPFTPELRPLIHRGHHRAQLLDRGRADSLPGRPGIQSGDASRPCSHSSGQGYITQLGRPRPRPALHSSFPPPFSNLRAGFRPHTHTHTRRALASSLLPRHPDSVRA